MKNQISPITIDRKFPKIRAAVSTGNRVVIGQLMIVGNLRWLPLPLKSNFVQKFQSPESNATIVTDSGERITGVPLAAWSTS